MIKKNIEVTINSKTRQVFFEDNFLGIKGENLQGYLVFKFQDEFVNGVATLKVEQEGNKYNIYEVEKENDSYKVIIKSSLLKSPIIYMALTITESGKEDEIPIFISNKFFMLVGETIESDTTIPDEYNSWIDIANTKLNQVDNLNIDMLNGVVTITKKDGTQYSENVKGDKGDKGDAGSVKFIIANELPTENIDDSAIYMIPAEATIDGNTYEEYIYVNGQWESLGSASVNVDLTDYAKKTDIPNVDNFITKDVSNLTNYYNKTEINSIIGNIETLLSEV